MTVRSFQIVRYLALLIISAALLLVLCVANTYFQPAARIRIAISELPLPRRLQDGDYSYRDLKATRKIRCIHSDMV